MLSVAARAWKEGAFHGFPRCCRARYVFDRVRPHLSDLFPADVAARLRRLSPRRALADGMVPCEWHALAYVLTGDRSGWRHPRPPRTTCCDVRERLVDGGEVRLWRERIEPDPHPDHEVCACGTDAPVDVWIFALEPGDDAPAISVTHCPWCGAALDAP